MTVFLNLFQNLNQKKNVPQIVSQVKNYPNVEARKLSNKVREMHTIILMKTNEKDFQQYVNKLLHHRRCMWYLTTNTNHHHNSNDETAPEEAHVQSQSELETEHPVTNAADIFNQERWNISLNTETRQGLWL